jgi:hypothetical protein
MGEETRTSTRIRGSLSFELSQNDCIWRIWKCQENVIAAYFENVPWHFSEKTKENQEKTQDNQVLSERKSAVSYLQQSLFGDNTHPTNMFYTYLFILLKMEATFLISGYVRKIILLLLLLLLLLPL